MRMIFRLGSSLTPLAPLARMQCCGLQLILNMWSTTDSFERHVDHIVSTGNSLVVGLSDLEGNTWGGAISVVDFDGHEIATVQRSSGVSALCMCGDGNAMVAVGGDDGDIQVLSSTTLEEFRTIPAHDSIVSSISCSNRHKKEEIISAGWDGSIKVWDLSIPENRPVRSIAGHSGAIYATSCTENHPFLLATASQDGYACVWDLRQQTDDGFVHGFNATQACTAVAFNPTDSCQLIIGQLDGVVQLYDVRKPGEPFIRDRLHAGRVNQVTWGIQGEDDVIVSCGGRSVTLARVSSSQKTTTGGASWVTRQLEAGADYVRGFVSTLQDGRHVLYTACMDKTVGMFSFDPADICK